MMKKNMLAFASLNKLQKSPRKMRMIAKLIKNKDVKEAITLLNNIEKKENAIFFKKLIFSLLSNWKRKYGEIEYERLFLKNITVNQGKTLKRLKPVPQGRGHRIRKRSSNITIFLEKKQEKEKKRKKQNKKEKQENIIIENNGAKNKSNIK